MPSISGPCHLAPAVYFSGCWSLSTDDLVIASFTTGPVSDNLREDLSGCGVLEFRRDQRAFDHYDR